MNCKEGKSKRKKPSKRKRNHETQGSTVKEAALDKERSEKRAGKGKGKENYQEEHQRTKD